MKHTCLGLNDARFVFQMVMALANFFSCVEETIGVWPHKMYKWQMEFLKFWDWKTEMKYVKCEIKDVKYAIMFS